MTLAALWLSFVLCMAAIGLAGYRLTLHAGNIAEHSGLTRSWIGLALLATVTSLPELATGLSAVTAANAPDIAIADAIGSCVFNMALITVLDFLNREASVYTRGSHGHILSGAFGVVLIGFTGLALIAAQAGFQPAIGHVGIFAPLALVLYLLAARTVFRYERRNGAVPDAGKRNVRVLRKAWIRAAAASSVVVGAGIWLPFIASELARQTGWSESFVGTLLVAAATSAPEMAVTASAFRLGALDMAIANLLGSNLFDIAIIAVDDFFFTPGPILVHVSPVHAVSAFSATAMTGLAIVGLVYRPQQRFFGRVGWISIAFVLIYLLNSYILFSHGR